MTITDHVGYYRGDRSINYLELRFEFQGNGIGVKTLPGANNGIRGNGVLLDGNYVSVDPAKPTFYLTGEGEEIYFKNYENAPVSTKAFTLEEEKYNSDDEVEISFELMKIEVFGGVKLGMDSAALVQMIGAPSNKTEEVFVGSHWCPPQKLDLCRPWNNSWFCQRI